MDVICPVEGCGKELKMKGLFFHIKNLHPKEYEEIGWRKLKSKARSAPKRESPKAEPQQAGPAKPNPEDTAWFEEVEKKYGFFPNPASLAIMQTFSKAADASKFINEAILNEGRRRGVTAAMIKTEGGQAMNLIPNESADVDKEFNRLLKLITVSNQMNQSYNQNSPMIQMMQIMKERVGGGMSMGEFMKDLMKIKLQQQMMTQRTQNPFPMMMMMMRLNRRRR